MSKKKLVTLTILAVHLVGLAVYTSLDRNTAPPDQLGKAVFPELAVGDAAELKISTDADSLTIVRVEGRWLSLDRFNYPVEFGLVKDLLFKLRDMKVGRLVDADDDQRARMRLTPPGSGSESGTLIEVRDSSQAGLASLLVGDTRTGKTDSPSPYGAYPEGQFVSSDNGASAILVKESFDRLPTNPADWLEKELLSVTAADVMSVTVVHTNGATLPFSRESEGADFKMDGIAEDEEPESYKVGNVASALNYLSLEDIADPALSDEAMGLDKPTTYIAHTIDSTSYKVIVGGSPEGSGSRYVRITPSAGPAPTVEEKAEDVTGEGSETEDPLAAYEKVKADVAALTAKLSPWTFVISSYKCESLAPNREDLVKKKEEPKDDTEAGQEPGKE